MSDKTPHASIKRSGMTTRSQSRKRAAEAPTATLEGQSVQSQAINKNTKTQAAATHTQASKDIIDADPRYTTPAPDLDHIPKSVLQAPRKPAATKRKLPRDTEVPEGRALRRYRLGSQGTILNPEDKGRLLVSQDRGHGLPPTPLRPQGSAQSENARGGTSQSADTRGPQRRVLLGPHGTELDPFNADEEVLRNGYARWMAEDLTRE